MSQQQIELFFLFHKANLEGMKAKLQRFEKDFIESDPFGRTVEENWMLFKQYISTAINEFVPTKYVKRNNDLPCMDQQSTQVQNEKFYDHARFTKNPRDWAAYKKLKNEIIIDLQQAHDAYCNHMFDATYTSNRKRFWSYIKLQHDFSNIATLCVNNKELLTPSDKANALNDQFVSVFTRENSDIPKLPMNQYPALQDIIFSTIGIKCILEKLDPSRSAGPDNIPSRILKLCDAEVSPFLQFIFTQSLNEGILPSDWLKANITPIYKKGDRSDPANYRPLYH